MRTNMTPEQQFSRLVKIATLGFILIFGYFLLADNTIPLTPQAMATRAVTKVTPQISGKIQTISVINNQSVKKGDLLFRIDPAPYQLAVSEARLALEEAKQDNAELDASILAAEADIKASRATTKQKRSEAKRFDSLYLNHGISQQQKDQADSDATAANANFLAANARLKKLRINRGSHGEGNLKLRRAENNLAQAKLNLSYTDIHADQAGVVTNLQLEVGSFATVGQPLLAVISNKVDIIADFREKNLRNVKATSSALIAFDGVPGHLYPATVKSIDAGVSAGQFNADGRLAEPEESTRWVRDAQRLRLHLSLDDLSTPSLPAGARATVQLLPENIFFNFFATSQIKLISLLHYIY